MTALARCGDFKSSGSAEPALSSARGGLDAPALESVSGSMQNLIMMPSTSIRLLRS